MNFSNINKIKNTIKNNQGFDVVIVVASGGNSKYWERRLPGTRNYILPKKVKIICLEEDWRGSAGQLLGTLYAFKKASRKLNLSEILKNKGTIAIYHTAGHGKRMAPLTAAEGNNKPAIKLPKILETKDGNTLLTILEAVIFSTQIFAQSREGRLSVFWGDQIIIPSNTPGVETKLAVEIFGIKKKLVLEEKEWNKNWKDYGILIPQKKRGVLQREKLSWEKINNFYEKGYLRRNSEGKVVVSRSMGCFSMNSIFLHDLLDEFSKELKMKKGKFDTDPHLWMPLTSSQEEYSEGGGDITHFKRIKKFKEKFQEKSGAKLIVGEKNLGKDTIWWDYGNLADYHRNLLVAVEKDKEGEAAREFFGLKDLFVKEKKLPNLEIKNSIIIDSEVKEGSIKDSIIASSKIKKAIIEKTFLVNSKIKEAESKNSLFYFLDESNEIKTLPGEVAADIRIGKKESVRIKTNLSRDGKKDWEIKLPQNPLSYSEIERRVSKLTNKVFRKN